jgi:glutathione S-transferase
MTTDTLELYYSPSTASLAVHWLLIELNLPHTLHRLDLAAGEHKQPAYLALNPGGVVPTLLVNGAAVFETSGILLYLAELEAKASNGAALAPPPATLARAHYFQWMCFAANTLQPAYRDWFYPSESAGAQHADIVKAGAQRKIEGAWQRIEQHLAQNGPYIVGAQMSAADFLITMLMRWSRNMPKPADNSPALKAYAQRMKSLASFKTVYAREELTDWV